MRIFIERALGKACRENQNCHFERYKARCSNGRFSYRSSIYLSFIGIKVLVIKHHGSITGPQKLPRDSATSFQALHYTGKITSRRKFAVQIFKKNELNGRWDQSCVFLKCYSTLSKVRQLRFEIFNMKHMYQILCGNYLWWTRPSSFPLLPAPCTGWNWEGMGCNERFLTQV